MTQPFVGNHVIFGASAAGSWLQAFQDNKGLKIHLDPLSCGPIKRCSSLDEFRSSRNSYLQSLYDNWEDLDERHGEFNLSKNAERLAEHDNTYIWLSTGLDEQLLLLFTIYLLRSVGALDPKVAILLFESTANRRFPIRGLGELRPDQIESFPKPFHLENEHLEYCDRLWHAVTDPDPAKLVSECRLEGSPLPAVPAALKYLLRRFPQRNSGLMFWDERLLKSTADYGPRAAYVIGHTMGWDLADRDLVGDAYLFDRLHHLAGLPRPLIDLSGKVETIRGTEVYLTPFGEEVCQGGRTSLPDNPVDEWVGGVHISSNVGRIWLYEEGNLLNAGEI